MAANILSSIFVVVRVNSLGRYKTQVIHRMQIWRTTRSSPGTSHESEASEASVFCFDNASPEKSYFVDGLVCFI